jgi:hypothetical protein
MSTDGIECIEHTIEDAPYELVAFMLSHMLWAIRSGR